MLKPVLFRFLKVFINAILAGLVIGLAGTAFYYTLRVNLLNPIFAGLLFAVGYLLIGLYGYELFAFRSSKIFEEKKVIWLDLILILLGNILGAYLIGGVNHIIGGDLISSLQSADTSFEVLPLLFNAILGGLLIYFIFNTYKKAEQPIARFAIIFVGAAVMMMAGFKEVTFEAFYHSIVEPFSGGTTSRIFLIAAGNLVGAIIIPSINLLKGKLR